MSKKKSHKSATNTLDDNLIVEEQPKATSTPDGEISLEEFNKNAPYAFNKKNNKLLFTGLAINVLGFILMIGGGADGPNDFDAEKLFGTLRITIAPMFIVLGYVMIMYSIMRKPKTDQQ